MAWRLLLMMLAATLLGGCQKEETITVAKVAYPDREAVRMLAALVQARDQTWVFKLQGPPEEIEQEQKKFTEFLSSLQFDDKKEPPLSWRAPAGWQEEPGTGLRYVTFRIAAQPRPLEMTVTLLPGEGGNLLQNVNRWRKQLSLSPLETADLAAETRPTTIAGLPGHVVDMTGLGTHSVSEQPAQARPPHPPMLGRKKSEPGGLPFSYEAPAGWEKDAQAAGLSAVSFTVRDGGKKAIVTLTPLGGPAGGWAQNIERWRGQVKLPRIAADELARQVKEIEVGGASAKYVDLDNPEAAVPDNRILGVVAPLGERTWFFKMTGPSDVVGRHKTEFESLVKSVKLGGKE